MRKPYKTKKRKLEFNLAYSEIGELNSYIIDYEIEIDTFISHCNFDEAILRQKTVNEMKLRLLELGKLGWDISYTTNKVSGWYTKQSTPKLI